MAPFGRRIEGERGGSFNSGLIELRNDGCAERENVQLAGLVCRIAGTGKLLVN